jgi:thiamine biosynthesis lipoprotein
MVSRSCWIREHRLLSALSVVLIFLPVAHAWGAERLSFQRHLMGTSVEILVWGTEREALSRAVERAYEEVERIETRLSVRNQGSDLSEINRSAGMKPVRVDEELCRLIRESIRYSALSGGAFDVTVQGLGDLWDFSRADFHVPAPELVQSRLVRVDHRKIRLDERESTVFLERKGMAISLAGIAKGYAADRAVGILRESGVGGGVVSAGGDLLAFGRREDGEVWQVGVRNPRNPARNIAMLPASDLAVATSGDYERYRIVEGRRYHHILDPRTGYPVTGCMSATVVARSAMQADALATALFVLGPERGLELAERLPGVEAIVVDAHGDVTASSGLWEAAEGLKEVEPGRLDRHPKPSREGPSDGSTPD